MDQGRNRRESDAGEFVEYEDREGLKKLADGVKERGRKLLAQETRGE